MTQSAAADSWRVVELNGGRVERGATWRFTLPLVAAGYANAQIDDYGPAAWRGHACFRWRPGVTLSLRARFSHEAGALRGTAGFGFWNSPYGDPSVRRLALPQAAWFFFASAPNDLPFAPESPGRGWFAATVDAATPMALGMAPFAPVVLALNQFAAVRRRLWPVVQRRLGIGFAPLSVDLREWREYRLEWRSEGCRFLVDGRPALETAHSPRGPLGFVCWMDNQYLVLTPRGRFRAGVLPLEGSQRLEIDDLALAPD
jgi:hypothetical protein